MKKILAFISPFNQFFSLDSDPDPYKCPDGSVVEGKQTNEAPFKCLLNRDSEIEEIICFLSNAAKNPGKHGISPYDYLREQIGQQNPDVRFIPIHFPEDKTLYDGPLQELLEQMKPEDQIYLETSGGFRDAVYQLLLISRILQYQGTRLAGAVYSRLPNRIIQDVTGTYQSFDLINGLNEFQHFASVATMEQYYGKGSGALQELLNAMQKLSDSITLCRTDLEESLSAFRMCLDAADTSEDPLMHILLPIFRQKFSQLKTIPDIVRWCLDNNMMQQALTIYNERMPHYLLGKKRILQYPSSAEKGKSDFQDKHSHVLNRSFLFLGQHAVEIPEAPGTPEAVFRQYMKEHGEELLVANGLENLKVPPGLESTIARILQLRKLMYTNASSQCGKDCRKYTYNPSFGACQGCYQKDWVRTVNQDNQYHAFRPLCALKTPLKSYLAKDFVQNILLLKTDALGTVLGIKDPPAWDTPVDKLTTRWNRDYAVLTIKFMEEVLPGSGYTLGVAVDEMKRICTDFIYVRAIRNQINHSADELGASQNRIRFLTDLGYPTVLEELSLADIKRVVYDALDFIDNLNVSS